MRLSALTIHNMYAHASVCFMEVEYCQEMLVLF